MWLKFSIMYCKLMSDFTQTWYEIFFCFLAFANLSDSSKKVLCKHLSNVFIPWPPFVHGYESMYLVYVRFKTRSELLDPTYVWRFKYIFLVWLWNVWKITWKKRSTVSCPLISKSFFRETHSNFDFFFLNFFRNQVIWTQIITTLEWPQVLEPQFLQHVWSWL